MLLSKEQGQRTMSQKEKSSLYSRLYKDVEERDTRRQSE